MSSHSGASLQPPSSSPSHRHKLTVRRSATSLRSAASPSPSKKQSTSIPDPTSSLASPTPLAQKHQESPSRLAAKYKTWTPQHLAAHIRSPNTFGSSATHFDDDTVNYAAGWLISQKVSGRAFFDLGEEDIEELDIPEEWKKVFLFTWKDMHQITSVGGPPISNHTRTPTRSALTPSKSRSKIPWRAEPLNRQQPFKIAPAKHPSSPSPHSTDSTLVDDILQISPPSSPVPSKNSNIFEPQNDNEVLDLSIQSIETVDDVLGEAIPGQIATQEMGIETEPETTTTQPKPDPIAPRERVEHGIQTEVIIDTVAPMVYTGIADITEPSLQPTVESDVALLSEAQPSAAVHPPPFTQGDIPSANVVEPESSPFERSESDALLKSATPEPAADGDGLWPLTVQNEAQHDSAIDSSSDYVKPVKSEPSPVLSVSSVPLPSSNDEILLPLPANLNEPISSVIDTTAIYTRLESQDQHIANLERRLENLREQLDSSFHTQTDLRRRVAALEDVELYHLQSQSQQVPANDTQQNKDQKAFTLSEHPFTFAAIGLALVLASLHFTLPFRSKI